MVWPFQRRQWEAEDALAIVTGASSGIGRELTRLLVQNGCRVIAVARRAERLDELRDRCGDAVIPVVGDVADPATMQTAFAVVTQSRRGTLDLLVNNAGIGGIGPFIDADEDRLRQIMEVNFFAPAGWIRRAIPVMHSNRNRHPVICNIGSVLGHCGVPHKSEYCASKFALHGFTDALRSELSGLGIAMTLVSPSTTRSEFFESLVGTDAGQVSRSLGSWPPERVAEATLRAIKNRKRECILSFGGKALVYTDRWFPTILSHFLARSTSVSETDSHPAT